MHVALSPLLFNDCNSAWLCGGNAHSNVTVLSFSLAGYTMKENHL